MTNGNTTARFPLAAAYRRWAVVLCSAMLIAAVGCGGGVRPTDSSARSTDADDAPQRTETTVANVDSLPSPKEAEPVTDSEPLAPEVAPISDDDLPNGAAEETDANQSPLATSTTSPADVVSSSPETGSSGEPNSVPQESTSGGRTNSDQMLMTVAASDSDLTSIAPAESLPGAAKGMREDEAKQEGYPDAYFELPVWNREGPRGAARVSFDDFDLLTIMGLDPVPAGVGPDLPERIQRLDGMRVRLRGFMYPPYATEGLRGFVLARDNEICCFGRSPKIYDLVPVELSPGVTTRYIEGRPFDVVGVLHVAPEADDDELYQFLYMDDAIVIE